MALKGHNTVYKNLNKDVQTMKITTSDLQVIAITISVNICFCPPCLKHCNCIVVYKLSFYKYYLFNNRCGRNYFYGYLDKYASQKPHEVPWHRSGALVPSISGVRWPYTNPRLSYLPAFKKVLQPNLTCYVCC